MTKEPKQGPCECVADLTDLEQAVMIDAHALKIGKFVFDLMREDGTDRPCIGRLALYTLIARIISDSTETGLEEDEMFDDMVETIADIIQIHNETEESTEQNAPTSNCVH